MHSNPKVSCVLINYNGAKFLKLCLESLLVQDYKNFEIIFLDNNSQDNSVEIVKKSFPKIKILRNKVNLGYTGAANQAISITDGKYLMIFNPDIIYEKNYLSLLVKKMEENSKIGVIGGKWLKYDFEKNKKTNLIDSVGLYCYRNRRVIDRGQGLEDKGQYDDEEEVFGISGASPMYRREALIDIGIPPAPFHLKGENRVEVFDEDFFMYKEDIDVSWRLLLRGFLCFYFPKAIAYHGRGTGVLKRFTHVEVMKNRRKLSRFTKVLSYKNQRLMQVKNEIFSIFIKDFFHILWKEILIFGYMLILEPYLLKSVFEFFKKLPSALRKRKWIMKNRKCDLNYVAKFLRG
jgi:GT2 family glycosyltransferase